VITNLVLVNFQSHTSSELHFSPGVNMITGNSQSGKTAVLRAINLGFFNKPLGDSFIHAGCESCDVGIEIVSGDRKFSVLRHKGKDDNFYELSSEGAKPATFRAFGTDVPEAIQKLFNISDINIQDQFSPYFLVLDSPGQIAQYIRKVAQLDEVDHVVSCIAGKIKIIKDNLSSDKNENEDVEIKIKLLEKIDLKKLEDLITQTQGLEEKRNSLSQEYHLLLSGVNQLKEVEKSFTFFSSIDFDLLNKDLEVVRDLLTKRDKISSSYTDLLSLLTSLKDVEKTSIVLPDNLEAILLESDDLITLRFEVDGEVKNLSSMLVDLKSVSKDILTVDSNILSSQEEERILLSQITVCPYCKTSLNDSSRKNLLENVK
jgi:exonuclease SbcC